MLASPRSPPLSQWVLRPNPARKGSIAAAELQRLARANGFQFSRSAGNLLRASHAPAQRGRRDCGHAARHSSGCRTDGRRIIRGPICRQDNSSSRWPASSPPRPAQRDVQLWRGYVRYADTQKASCWARVKLTAHYTVVVAAKDLQPGQALEAAALRLETRTGPLEPRTGRHPARRGLGTRPETLLEGRLARTRSESSSNLSPCSGAIRCASKSAAVRPACISKPSPKLPRARETRSNCTIR